ncbi:MAG: hypothetical protein SGI74_06900 [Oligoflexia bacterium]|nr:hypothetical protein [Oligoflexia bacterium]
MIHFIFLLILTPSVATAEPATLSWWFLPESSLELPHETEEDETGHWVEIWERSDDDFDEAPTGILERSVGARWAGFKADRLGKPTRAILVLADRRIVDFDGEKARTGVIQDGEKITWSDGSIQKIVEFKKKRRRSRSSKPMKINFGKIAIPAAGLKLREVPAWSVEGISTLLEKLSKGLESKITPRDLSSVAQISDFNGSALNFKYATNCSFNERVKIEDALAEIEPKLTCWMEQNKTQASRLLVALLQQPIIDCRARPSMNADACAMSSLPFNEGFFVTQPRINLALSRCGSELGDTLLHETFHLAGIPENTELLDKARVQSESCESSPAKLNYENPGEGFMNDFQVGTRIFLFRKIKEEAVEKWGWSQGEKAFMLGTLCLKMGDKYCSRTYFQQAANSNLLGFIELPEGGEVTWSSLAQFYYFDSISEDLFRMRQLVNYLRRDPQGPLLLRLESDNYRRHEFHVARSTLEAVRNNKGMCNAAVDEKVYCEDLSAIVQTPWFKNH